MALAGLAGCTKQPDEPIYPYVKAPEDLVLGKPMYFATAHPFTTGAVPLLVKSDEFRPIKIDGNPEHAYNHGSSDPYTQGTLLDLYDPDRSQHVTYQGDGRSWGEFAQAVQDKHESLRDPRVEMLIDPEKVNKFLDRYGKDDKVTRQDAERHKLNMAFFDKLDRDHNGDGKSTSDKAAISQGCCGRDRDRHAIRHESDRCADRPVVETGDHLSHMRDRRHRPRCQYQPDSCRKAAAPAARGSGAGPESVLRTLTAPRQAVRR